RHVYGCFRGQSGRQSEEHSVRAVACGPRDGRSQSTGASDPGGLFMSFEAGSRIGDYEVAGVLGTGGMGKVYKVRNTISDRVEAMKVLLPDLTEMADLESRFLREIKLLATLSHPNIAGLHTALRVENQLLMIMELVEGTTVAQRLQQGPLSLQE